MTKNLLIIVDPQNDFIEIDGALPIPSAITKANNIAQLINRLINEDRFEKEFDVVISLDAHPKRHLSTSEFWAEKPKEFSTINEENFNNFNPLYYVSKSELPITIWPKHCVKYTPGYCIYTNITKALDRTTKSPLFVEKGTDFTKEEYSLFAVKNPDVINKIQASNNIYILGFAGDVCVKNTIKDLVSFHNNKEINLISKLNFVTDCIASVSTDIKRISVYNEAVENLGAKYIKSEEI